MNEPVLNQMLRTTDDTAKRFQSAFRIFSINTSGKQPGAQKRIAESVAELALQVIEEHLQEEILVMDKSALFDSPVGCRFFPESAAKTMIDKFSGHGRFCPRDVAENDAKLIQALPVVIVRKKNGDVLRLKRKEERQGLLLDESENGLSNLLNEKIVIWAGGHARKEDKSNGETLVQCALRELQEELRLSLEAHELSLRGAIYSDENPKSAKHLAIIYEWRAERDDVAVALCSSEFFERRGTSLSGTFIPVTDLAREVENGNITEQWSVEIVREVLAKGEFKIPGRLL